MIVHVMVVVRPLLPPQVWLGRALLLPPRLPPPPVAVVVVRHGVSELAHVVSVRVCVRVNNKCIHHHPSSFSTCRQYGGQNM
jgi:hypothetical protein